jgi:dTDP-4-dehydrorhamnose reductase
MKILVLGSKGMAGHVMASYFMNKPKYDVIYTSRELNENSLYLDVTDFNKIEEIIESKNPEIIINCVDILNDHASNNPLLAFQINSLLPHQLAKLTDRYQGKLVHISTDCVFSGIKGDYIENDIPDGTSVYAQSKRLGEIIDNKHLTIRTSITGPELKEDGIGLFSRFMKQNGEIKGYKKALWNGVTTLELAKATEKMIMHKVTGLYHLGSETKVSKYELLKMIQKVFEKNDVKIIPDHEVVLDRTIKSTRTDFQYFVPFYEDMLVELRDWLQKQ